MFTTLQDRLSATFKNLRGKGKLSDADIAFAEVNTMTDLATPSIDPDRYAQIALGIEAEIGKVIVGQHALVRSVLVCLLCEGHALLEGVPGLGKTMLLKTLSDVVTLDFSRVQFTPDLMPSDVTGQLVLDVHLHIGRQKAEQVLLRVQRLIHAALEVDDLPLRVARLQCHRGQRLSLVQQRMRSTVPELRGNRIVLGHIHRHAAHLGHQHAQAIQEVEELEKGRSPSGETCYNLACVHAVAAGVVYFVSSSGALVALDAGANGSEGAFYEGKVAAEAASGPSGAPCQRQPAEPAQQNSPDG